MKDIKEEGNFESGESRPKRKVSKEGAAISDDINLHWNGSERECFDFNKCDKNKQRLLIF